MKLRGTKYIVGFLAGSIIFGGGAYALTVANTPETGYLVCVNAKTKVVTYPGTLKCPKGNKVLQLGAQGLQGLPGPTGAPGASGVAGPSGSPGTPGFYNVYDANGRIVGPLVGSSPGLFSIKIGQAVVGFESQTGNVPVTWGALRANSQCTGAAFVNWDYLGDLHRTGASNPLILREATGQVKLYKHPQNYPSPPIGTPLWQLDGGGCQSVGLSGSNTYDLVEIATVTEPLGPLTIGN